MQPVQLMKLGLAALLALGLFAVTAAGCGGNDEGQPEALPTETATTATPATEPFTNEPMSAAETALVAVEAAGMLGATKGSAAINVGRLLTELQQDCGNTLENLAAYTLEAVMTLRAVGVDVLPTHVLIDVSTEAIGASGIDCQEFFTAYVNAHGG
jgi:hypothetical protein